MLFFDFEVFYADWMLVVLDSTDHSKHVFINQNDEFIQFYQDHKNDVWTGFNSRHYDQYIAKSIIAGFAPQMMNAWIINKQRGGWEFSSEINRIQFYTFDLMTVRGQSLKQLEGFMGDSVEETKVDFTIQRKLTQSEIDEVIEYCTHDVEETVNVFILRKEEWDSQMGLIKEFGLPLRMVGKTKAQLAAVILGAHKPAKDRDDEMDISFPDTMQVSKYKNVVDFYRTTRDYEQSFIRNVAGVKHIFAWGGLHGARENYHAKGTIINVDVGSYYPSIMIRYNYMSRNIKDKEKFVEIYKQRLEYKAKHDPRQAPRKIVLNSTYGATKDKYNDLYDPRQANNVCVGGMMLLLDLIEKLEPYVELIQSNTDGLYVRLLDDSYFSKVDDICWEWEQRTGMSLEFNQYDEIYQKDVNNYIIIDRVGDHVKTKGAYVKGLHDLDYDLPIVNKAVVDYFVHGTNPRTTVDKCNDLREFQRVVKLSYKYDGAALGGKIVPGKVFRVFADKRKGSPRLSKIKNGSMEKISYTPAHVFIRNGEVTGMPIPDELDRSWYWHLAGSRIKNFLGEE